MPEAPTPDTHAHPPRTRGKRRLLWLALPLGMVALAAVGLVTRQRSHAALEQWTDAQAIPSVVTVTPKPMPGQTVLTLPGNVDAFYEAPIYARVDGYLKAWYRDIGAHVRRGDVLARIEAPELDEQLNQARARVQVAAADERLAALTAARWKALLATRSVAQQTADEKVGEAEARKAALLAAQADVSRLEALEGFKTIVAPFDGIVTARRTDIGALIQAGSGDGHELFRVADVHEMRVYVPVPQAFTAQLTPGTEATLALPQYPGRQFPARLDTSANAVNAASRTALFELLAPNPDGALWPGTYTEVSFHIARPATHLSIPAGALIFQQAGPQVALLDRHDRVVMRPVKLGQDNGTEIEVLGGLSASDRVIDNPPDSLNPGDQVRPTAETQLAGDGRKHP